MRTYMVMAIVLSSVSARAQTWSHPLPTRDQLALARQLKDRADQLTARIGKLEELRTKADAALVKAGVRLDRSSNRAGHKQDPAPTAEEMTAIDADVATLDTDSRQLKADCTAYEQDLNKLALQTPLHMAQSSCEGALDSEHKPHGDCVQWHQLDSAFVLQGKCSQVPSRVANWVHDFRIYRADWGKAHDEETAARAEDAILTTAVSGNVMERAVPIPRAFRKSTATTSIVDARGVFDAANPSHFVFLRKDVATAPRGTPDESSVAFTRTLKKGEAVLPIRSGHAYAGYIEILSVDGNRGYVRSDDVAIAPLSGVKVMPLTADDLDVTDAAGKVLAGPRWLGPDATGFNLDEPNGWLDLLEPPEPRSQKFIEAKEKVLTCYNKQMERLDPEGTLRKYYDVVTYGRYGIEKVESAAVNFDRKACGPCGCRAFNETKRKLIKAAIAAAQKTAFEPYKPVIEKLAKTDFVAAAKGAAKGTAEPQGQPY